MNKVDDKLVILYQKMADMTSPLCAGKGKDSCKPAHSCCDISYCDITQRYAKEEYGITLHPTGHPSLTFMGDNGCTVPPYLRPMCTMHVCKINSLGFFPKDAKLTKQYFKLREEIEQLENDKVIS